MIVAVTAFAGGCSFSTLDADVFIAVDHAVVEVDAQQPGALAQIDVSVTFDAQSRATRELDVRGAELVAGAQSIPLALAVPDGFDMSFEPNERRTAQLVNAGVTNADLMSACAGDWLLSVRIAGANGRDQDADDDENDEPFDEHREFSYGFVPTVLNCQP